MDLASILASCADPVILPSAHRERQHSERPISDADILHAYRNGIQVAVNTGRNPHTYILVGPGTSGVCLYEVGVMLRSWTPGTYDVYIVHAMRARYSYEMQWMTRRYQGDERR